MISFIFVLFQQSLLLCIFFSDPGSSIVKHFNSNGGKKRMPDWFTHSLVGWMIGKTTKMDIGLVVIGALIPDLVKISLAFTWLGLNNPHIFYPLHTPIGALIFGGLFSLFFIDSKKVFIFLSFGILSHFILDIILVHVAGGIKLIFPFSWDEWQIYLMRSDDYFVTILI